MRVICPKRGEMASAAVEETAALIIQILRGRGLDEDARRRW